MESRFSVRRVEQDPAVDQHQLTMAGVGVGGSGATNGNGGPKGASPNDMFNATSTTCLCEPADRKPSIVHLTLEALPRVDYYRNALEGMKRPSLGEIHGEDPSGKDVDSEEQPNAADGHGGGHGIKLGWIQGVLIPCLLNIWGVMLFLRLSWVVAQSGIGQSLVIIGISAVVCVLTTLSLSAISTNGEVKGGGIYYIISRSLGPEFGASIGIVFAFANAVAASMNTIGFCNSLNDLLKSQGVKIVDGGNNDVRIVGVVALLVMVMICAVGMEWESKAQNFLIAIILGAIIDFLVGTSLGPGTDEEKAKGFAGFSVDVLRSNWGPSYRFSEKVDQDFFSVFAIFFPSVTGIQAGANISGDLKDPAAAIPKGTLLALLLSMFSYAVFVVFAGGAALRDASGNITEVALGTYADCANRTCEYGLMNSYSVMQLMSAWGPFIYAGCFAATLSTALTNLLSVPRLIQALGIDRIYPGLIFFSKGYGKSGEPYRGYVITFFVSAAFLLIAELNVIAPLISNFYLASYALINFCTFHAALIKPLGWRPTFRFYNVWLSLLGFILCVTIMFLIDWVTSLITFIIIFALYLIVVYRRPDVNWGSSTQAQTYKTALTTAYRLGNIAEHAKNYRPQLLVLSGKPSARPPLIGLANLITKHTALCIYGDIITTRLSHRSRLARVRSGYAWLQSRRYKAFYTVLDGLSFEDGARALLQSSGIGKLKPNVLLMGYKSDWRTCNSEDLVAYFNILHNAFDNRMAATILRLQDGLDYSKVTDEAEVSTPTAASNCDLTFNSTVVHGDTRGEMLRVDSNLSFLTNHGSDTTLHLKDSTQYLPTDSLTSARRYNVQDKSWNLGTPKAILKSKKKAVAEQILKGPSGNDIPREVLANMTLFDRKQKKGTIDVWWLYDDGGLTILLPYIIQMRSFWSHCKLRVFALANRGHELELEERNMANLLSKFRIDYSSLKMVTGITEKPRQETVNLFNSLLEGFRESDGAHEDCRVSDSELVTLHEKTNRQLRLREMLQENSKDAVMVLMSLPMPRKGTVSAPLYMAWLEMLSRDMPPFLFVRGNHTSVLTFYS